MENLLNVFEGESIFSFNFLETDCLKWKFLLFWIRTMISVRSLH